jgi:hypothetical protein
MKIKSFLIGIAVFASLSMFTLKEAHAGSVIVEGVKYTCTNTCRIYPNNAVGDCCGGTVTAQVIIK